jgi:hypothetical protein
MILLLPFSCSELTREACDEGEIFTGGGCETYHVDLFGARDDPFEELSDRIRICYFSAGSWDLGPEFQDCD